MRRNTQNFAVQFCRCLPGTLLGQDLFSSLHEGTVCLLHTLTIVYCPAVVKAVQQGKGVMLTLGRKHQTVKMQASSDTWKKLRSTFLDVCVIAPVTKRRSVLPCSFDVVLCSSCARFMPEPGPTPSYWHGVYWNGAKNWWEAEREWAWRVRLQLQIRAGISHYVELSWGEGRAFQLWFSS